jgi:hypothetical protein
MHGRTCLYPPTYADFEILNPIAEQIILTKQFVLLKYLSLYG